MPAKTEEPLVGCPGSLPMSTEAIRWIGTRRHHPGADRGDEYPSLFEGRREGWGRVRCRQPTRTLPHSARARK